jgi:hypothetical protein
MSSVAISVQVNAIAPEAVSLPTKRGLIPHPHRVDISIQLCRVNQLRTSSALYDLLWSLAGHRFQHRLNVTLSEDP